MKCNAFTAESLFAIPVRPAVHHARTRYSCFSSDTLVGKDITATHDQSEDLPKTIVSKALVFL